jgi:hypothetical protein
MQYVQFYAARADTGVLLPYARATVFLTGTATPAVLFDAEGQAIDNPLTADAVGLLGFAAVDGIYDVEIESANGDYSAPPIRKLQVVDLSGVVGTITSGRKGAPTWAATAAMSFTAGELVEVPATDTGTHVDPISGLTVPNTGVFRYKTGSPSGLERIYAVDLGVRDAALRAQAWAEGIEPGGPGSRSAKGWAEDENVVAVAGAIDHIVALAPEVTAIGAVADELPAILGVSAEADRAEAASFALVARQEGLGGADRLTDVMQTADQLTLRSGTRLDLVRNRIVGPEYSSHLSHRMLKVAVMWAHSGGEGSGATFGPIETNLSIKSRLDPSGAGYNSLPGRIQQYLGSDWEVYNKSISIQQAEAIGARAGAIPVRITVTGNEVPAGGLTATLTGILPWPGPLEACGGRGVSIAGTINGAPVRLTINAAGTVYSIQQPSTAAAALPVPAGSVFVPAGTEAFRHAVNIFWLDRNGGNVPSSRYVTGQMAARVKDGRYLVLGDWNARNEPNGSARRNMALAINADLELAHPGNFFNILDFACGRYPYNGNVEPSAADMGGIVLDATNLGDITNGLFPRIFGAAGEDLVHFNTLFFDAAAKYIVQHRFPRMGWVY